MVSPSLFIYFSDLGEFAMKWTTKIEREREKYWAQRLRAPFDAEESCFKYVSHCCDRSHSNCVPNLRWWGREDEIRFWKWRWRSFKGVFQDVAWESRSIERKECAFRGCQVPVMQTEGDHATLSRCAQDTSAWPPLDYLLFLYFFLKIFWCIFSSLLEKLMVSHFFDSPAGTYHCDFNFLSNFLPHNFHSL